MINSKLFYFIPVFLLLIFSCQDDNQSNNSNNSCDGHLEYRINGVFREANCNFIEEGYGNDDIIIIAYDYNPTDTNYFYSISANESVGIGEYFSMSFDLPEPFTQPQTITTQYFPNTFIETGIGSFGFTDPNSNGIISHNFALYGSYATISIDEADGQYISGTFGALIIYDDPIQNDTTTYEITDGIFENVYLEPF